MNTLKNQESSLVEAGFPAWILIIYLFMVPGILAGGYLFYKIQSQQLQKNAESDMQAVGQLKVDQIVQWRGEMMRDAHIIMENSCIKGVGGLLDNQETFNKEFGNKNIYYPYNEILLTDTSGKILNSTENKTAQLSTETLMALKNAFLEQAPFMTDLHLNKTGTEIPQMDIAIPLFNQGGKNHSPVGAIILSIDARQYLYPLLQKWPVPAKTSETLIVRKEGDNVLFLNDLRHKKNTALKFTIPLTNRRTPAIMAVLGKEGLYTGIDYRGKNVIAMLRHIPNSPWYMVAKVDTEEAFAISNFGEGLIFLITLLLLLTILATTSLFWKNKQKRLYKSLYQSEHEKRALLKHFEYLIKYANDIIILAGSNLKIVEANDRALEEYGYTWNEMTNLALYELITESEYDLFKERLSTLKKNTSYLREGMHKRKDGSVFPVEISGRYVEVDGKFYFQAIIRNITERKKIEKELNEAHEALIHKYKELQASEEELTASFEEIQSAEEELAIQNEELRISKERAEESDKLKTAFLQNMSHEIRTPMNAILGFSQLLEENIYDPLKVKSFSRIINSRSSDLLSIINEILEVSQIETGQIRANEQTCDVNHLLDELFVFFTNYKQQIGKGHILLEYKKTVPDKSVLITDMVKFKQIFINLIQNALKYTMKGQVCFGYENLEKGYFVFFVSDTGIGIPENKYSAIFDRFTQVENGAIHSKEGLGLGLSIAKGLVTLLGGKIWLESELDHGTKFNFTIPYRVSAKNVEKENLIFSNTGYHWKDKTFLIVEDNLIDQEYFKRLLEIRGVRIVFVVTGKDAINIIMMGAKIDLILMDIKLPDMSGLEATKRIKAIKPNIPVIAQTAFAMEFDKKQSLAAGCDGYISKPIFVTDFLTLVSMHVNS